MSEEEKIQQPEFDKYMSYYNKTMELIIDLHNRHVSFKRWRGGDTAKFLRNTIRELVRAERGLADSAWKSYKEFLVISKPRRKYSERNKLKYKEKLKQNDTNN